MNDLERVTWALFTWAIESYHRGLKQFCLIERAQVRSRRASCSLPDRKIASRGGVVGKGQVFLWDLGKIWN